MRYSNILRLLSGCIGFLIAGSGLAMPPAPSGPYQSIEDHFIRVEPAPNPADAKPQRTAVKQAPSDEVHDWNWGVPSIRHLRQNDPALRIPEDGYPPVRQGSGPNGVPR